MLPGVSTDPDTWTQPEAETCRGGECLGSGVSLLCLSAFWGTVGYETDFVSKMMGIEVGPVSF